MNYKIVENNQQKNKLGVIVPKTMLTMTSELRKILVPITLTSNNSRFSENTQDFDMCAKKT